MCVWDALTQPGSKDSAISKKISLFQSAWPISAMKKLDQAWKFGELSLSWFSFLLGAAFVMPSSLTASKKLLFLSNNILPCYKTHMLILSPLPVWELCVSMQFGWKAFASSVFFFSAITFYVSVLKWQESSQPPWLVGSVDSYRFCAMYFSSNKSKNL